MKKTTIGFTIVELLIVIVVIAILATISVVAYRGIRNRAYDTIVRSDLANFAKKVQLIQAGTGEYPVGGSYFAVEGGGNVGHVSTAPIPAVDHSVSKSSYNEPPESGSPNYTYCTGIGLSSGSAEYVVTAQSKSMNVFQHSSMRGSEELPTVIFSSAWTCYGIGYPRSVSYGYFTNSGGWQSWTN